LAHITLSRSSFVRTQAGKKLQSNPVITPQRIMSQTNRIATSFISRKYSRGVFPLSSPFFGTETDSRITSKPISRAIAST
jgi:hypothetical protein